MTQAEPKAADLGSIEVSVGFETHPDGAASLRVDGDGSVRVETARAGERASFEGKIDPESAREMLEALDARSALVVIATAADWVRAMPPVEIAEAARSLGVDAEVVPSVGAAVDRAVALASEDDLVLVAGSLYVVGEARGSFARHG